MFFLCQTEAHPLTSGKMAVLVTTFTGAVPSRGLGSFSSHVRRYRSVLIPTHKHLRVRRTPCTRVLVANVHASFQPVDETVLRAVEQAHGNRVTPTDVATACGLNVPTVQAELSRLAMLTNGAIDVSKDGDLGYRIPGARAKLRAASVLYAASLVLRMSSGYGQKFVRLCFSAMLLSSLVLAATVFAEVFFKCAPD